MNMTTRMGRPIAELALTADEKVELQRLARRRTVGAALAARARIVLECGKGLENIQVAENLGITGQTVGKWRKRFVDSRLDGLTDEPRTGRPRTVSDNDVERIVDITLHEDPKAATQWSSRMLADRLGDAMQDADLGDGPNLNHRCVAGRVIVEHNLSDL